MKKFTITKETTNTLKIENSKFITYSYNLDTSAALSKIIFDLKSNHPNASHFCYAYIINQNEFRFSDDGEPKNTAGKPIYNVLKGANLENTLVVVVRYFGGTKLGVGGLIKAYIKSTQTILTCSQIKEISQKLNYKIYIPFTIYGKIVNRINRQKYIIIDEENLELNQHVIIIKIDLKDQKELFIFLNNLHGVKYEEIF